MPSLPWISHFLPSQYQWESVSRSAYYQLSARRDWILSRRCGTSSRAMRMAFGVDRNDQLQGQDREKRDAVRRLREDRSHAQHAERQCQVSNERAPTPQEMN